MEPLKRWALALFEHAKRTLLLGSTDPREEGFDLARAFAILGIIAIETGLLTPPFGILVFTVKAAVTDEKDLSTGEIFRGSVAYWIALLGVIILIAIFPQIATWLPNLGNAVGK